MPEITGNKRKTFGSQTLTVIESDGADTLTYNKASNQVLLITNNTAGAINLNIIGSEASNAYQCAGTGTTQDLTAGYPINVTAGASVRIELNSIKEWLAGNVSITGGATDVLYTLMQS